MIEFITDSGVALDIKKDSEFTIEYEQPLLDTDRIPGPQSTTIELPLSPTNNEAFGFRPGISITPNNKRIVGWLNYNSMNILHGTLEFDSFEDGVLKCSFNGFDLSELWSSNIDIEATETGTAAHDGTGNVLAPPIIHKSLVAVMAVPAEAQYDDNVETTDTSNEKYRNYLSRNSHGSNPQSPIYVETFCPAIKLSKIFSDKKISFPNCPTEFSQLAMLAPYDPTTEQGDSIMDVELEDEQWPEMTYAEIIKSILDIFCCSLFVSGEELLVKSFDNVSELSNALDWSAKSSDEFSSGIFKARRYSFEYANSDEFKELDGVTEINLSNYFSNLTVSDDYETVRIHETGDVISRKAHVLKNAITRERAEWSDYSTIATLLEADILSHDTRKKSGAEGPEEKFEAKSKFKLIAAVPDRYLLNETITRVVETKMKPIVDLPGVDDEKDSGAVYVGLIKPGCQMSDGQYYYVDNALMTDLSSLRPEDIFFKCHNTFSRWLGKEHETIKLKLNLTHADIAQFRMYKPVFFKNAYWMISKMSFTFKMSSEIIVTEGEFIRL